MNEELIQRFLSNKCTPEEAGQVADYLKANPALLDQYISEAEFIQHTTEGQLPERVSSEWLKHIHKVAVHQDRSFTWVRRMAVAAIVAGVIAGGSYLLMHHQNPQLTAKLDGRDMEKTALEYKVNNTSRNMAIVLPDGSFVHLMPRAAVSYTRNFTENRNIYLEGEADFEVVNDKLHAFTVHSDEVTTQVLGTRFHVKALQGDNIISVRLLTGKVMVSAEVMKKKAIDDIILLPGTELTYNRTSMTATVNDFNKASGSKQEILVKAGNNVSNGAVKPDWYKFSSQPMISVLDQLSDYYAVGIYYYPADVKNMKFEGKFEKTDSLEKILTDITLPNDLKFVKEQKGYIISKK